MAKGLHTELHTASPNEQFSIIPNVVSRSAVDGRNQKEPTQESAHTQVRISVQNEQVVIIPGIVSHSAPDEHTQSEPTSEAVPHWLEERMRQDRLALWQYMEQQHEKFISDFHSRRNRIDSKAASGMPRLGKQVSFSWRPAHSSASLTERVIQSATEQGPQETMKEAMKDGRDLDRARAGEGEGTVIVDTEPATEHNMASWSRLSQTTTQVLEDASERLNKVETVVEGQFFELACIAVIFLNAMTIALEQQYNGENLGCNLKFPSYEESRKWWPGFPTMFDALDKGFVAIFLGELVLRLLATRRRWFKSIWNYIDFLLVCMAVASWLRPIFGEVNPTFVRMVRFGKLARIMRVMRSNRLVESLKLLTASIQASLNTLFVSLFVLLLIHVVAAMLLSQLVEPFLKAEIDASDLHQQDVKHQVFAYYGTFWRSLITMFEITFANWAPTCRLLIDNVSEWFGLFFLLHRCVVGFAMLSVIQAVFIQQTMKSAQMDEDFMLQQKQREKESYAAKLKNVFKQLDTSGDGQLTWDEFHSLVSNDHMKLIMNTLDVDIRDLEALFLSLEDGDGCINADEFVDGFQRIKGPAQSLDMVNLLRIVGRIETKLARIKSMRTKSFLR